MGLHRDGETLNLTPFETEMRRRLWWHILMQDAKYAMLSGLSHSLIPFSWDTKTPSNVNDADLFPGSTEPIQPREGPTEMAFSLITCEVSKFLIHSQGIPGFEAVVLGNEIDNTKDPNINNDGVAKYRAMVDDLERRLRYVEDTFTDPNAGPLHAVCRDLRTNIIGKIRSMLIPMRQQPEWGTEILNPKDNLFKLVIVNNEHAVASYEMTKDKGFLWFTKLHFQVDVFALMVGQLSHRPTGSLSDRAWRQVELVYQYHDELLDLSQKQNLTLATFILRAWKAREDAFIKRGRPLPEVPSCIPLLRDLLPGSEPRTSDGTPSGSDTSSMPVPKGDVAMGLDPGLDQFLGGYLEMTPSDWDMWGDLATQGQDQVTALAFGGGFSNIGGIGPSGKW
jgi:hypothetical protein